MASISSHAAHPIQSCIIIGPQSAEIQSSDCENDLASSLSTVEQPEVSLTGTNEDHGPYDIGSLFDPSKLFYRNTSKIILFDCFCSFILAF